MDTASVLQHLQKQQAALRPRPNLAEVVAARQAIADVDRRLVETLEGLLWQSSPDSDGAASKKLQALKEEAARQSANAERAKWLAVLDLESQHQHYQKLIAQAEESLVSKPSANPPETSGSKLVSEEEARVNKLMQTIQRAEAMGLESLDLSEGFQGSLTWLPESLGHLTNLRELDISGHQLETIPDALSGLSQLRSLNLRSNKLRTLPESLGLLTNLTALNLASNNLHDLPATLSNCTALQELALDFNQLLVIPDHLFQSLQNLRRFTAHLNKLRSLPASIGQLTALEELDVHFNQLQYIPDSIGDCRNLRVLNLSSNFASLEDVPAAIGRLTILETLDLRNNQLEGLPLTFSGLTKLKTLLLDGNPLKDPPTPIAAKGAQAVVQYLALRQHLAEPAEGGGAGYGWLNGWLGGVGGLGLVEWLNTLFGGVARLLTTSTGAWMLGWNQTPRPRRIQEPEGRPLEEL